MVSLPNNQGRSKRRKSPPIGVLQGRRSRRPRLGVILCLVATLLCPAGTGASAEEFPEYQLKAAYLYNFAKFVTWPAKAFADPDAPLTIGILGEDPFGPLLKDTLQGKTVNGRKLVIKHFGRGQAATNCHILFISRSEKDYIPAILDSLKGASVLTVGELEKFAHTGGMINFIIASASVRFEINVQAAEAAGLQVSSKLWGVGILVKPDARKENK